MTDPVIGPDGRTYERATITKWLNDHHTSPYSNQHMEAADLIPNRAIIDAIEAFRAAAAVQGSPLPAEKEKDASTTTPLPSTFTVNAPAEKKKQPLIQSQYGVTLDVSANVSGEACISVSAGEGHGKRTPLDVVCLIDTSGSMSERCIVKTSKGQSCSSGLEVLDVVKHAVRTIYRLLGPNDRLSIVSFDSVTRVLLEAAPVIDANAYTINQAIDKMSANGATYMWPGIEQCFDLVGEHRTDRNPVIMMLTDGQPTSASICRLRCSSEPEEVNKNELGDQVSAHIKAYPICECPIETFGFGYAMESEILDGISRASGGSYHFIPDAGFVGTVMINSMANLMCTALKQAKVYVSPPGLGVPRQEIVLGAVRYGQTRDFVLNVPKVAAGSPYLSVSLNFSRADRCEMLIGQRVLSPPFPALGSPVDMDVAYHSMRTKTIALLKLLLTLGKDKRFTQANTVLAEAIANDAKEIPVTGGDQRALGMMEDLNGQVKEAMQSDQSYRRWGRHYLLSLMNAYEHEMCNNFKDPGVQLFGGDMFRAFRLEGSNLFDTLPAPSASATVSMSALNDSSAGCIDGECKVRVGDGMKFIKDLTNRDILSDTGAHVVCVTRHFGGPRELYRVGDALLTEYHPVLVDGKRWVYARDAATSSKKVKPSHLCVYNLVLSPPVPVVIGSTVCATLGMPAEVVNEGGETDNHSASFWGSESVITSLKGCIGWENGVVDIADVVRDKRTHTVQQVVPVIRPEVMYCDG